MSIARIQDGPDASHGLTATLGSARDARRSSARGKHHEWAAHAPCERRGPDCLPLRRVAFD